MEPSHLRRGTERGAYDLESIKAIFEDCFMAHVAYIDNGLPVCMPMIALIRQEEDEEVGEGPERSPQAAISNKAAVYLHGHPSSKLMELVREVDRETEETNNNEADNANRDNTKGKPKTEVKVCITSTKVDGLVLSSAPNGHTFNYRSAVIHGTCMPIHGKPLKRKIMHEVTNHIVANRWKEVNPVASFQVSLVYVIKVSIDSMSAKTRIGVPGIQPRNKEVDGPDIEPQPWTGVVPLWDQLGEPVDSGLTQEAIVSDNLRAYIQSRNKKHKTYAIGAAK